MKCERCKDSYPLTQLRPLPWGKVKGLDMNRHMMLCRKCAAAAEEYKKLKKQERR